MSRTTRILVSGGDGILATALRPFFPLATYCSRSDMDVANVGDVRRVFNEVKPELVIHCAAVTRHDAEPTAYTVGNIQGTINVSLAARKSGARMVYPSTDYLGARRETDPVSPVNGYSRSKYAGEIAADAACGPGVLVVRGSWYSRLEYSHAASDAFTGKVPVSTAAHWIAVLAVSSHTGVVNIGGKRRSVYEIALEFSPNVIPISRTQIHCGYEIPADCSLDTTRLSGILAA